MKPRMSWCYGLKVYYRFGNGWDHDLPQVSYTSTINGSSRNPGVFPEFLKEHAARQWRICSCATDRSPHPFWASGLKCNHTLLGVCRLQALRLRSLKLWDVGLGAKRLGQPTFFFPGSSSKFPCRGMASGWMTHQGLRSWSPLWVNTQIQNRQIWHEGCANPGKLQHDSPGSLRQGGLRFFIAKVHACLLSSPTKKVPADWLVSFYRCNVGRELPAAAEVASQSLHPRIACSNSVWRPHSTSAV